MFRKIRIFAAVIASALTLSIASTAFAGDMLTCGVEASKFPAEVQDAIDTIKSYFSDFSEEYVCDEYMSELENWEMQTINQVVIMEDAYEMNPYEGLEERLDTMIRVSEAFRVIIDYLQYPEWYK